MLKIIVFCSDFMTFEKQQAQLKSSDYTDQEIIFGDSESKSRQHLINENPGSWLLFLDHDCMPTEKSRHLISRLITENNSNRPVAFAGSYENPLKATALQKTHNKIANTWLKQSYSDPTAEPLLLGGIFLIYAGKSIPLPERNFWGAEDKLLAKNLRSAGYQIKISDELKAIHDTSKSFRHFVRRAILHGRHDAIYFKYERPAKISYWIQRIDFSDWRLVPLILLHFCIQKGAKAFQKALRKNTQ